jgi:hypothetical protein
MTRTLQSTILFAVRLTVIAAVLAAMLRGSAARAQALPAAEASPVSTGFTLPNVGGSLNWAVSASESLAWGYYGSSGNATGTNLSGDVAYLSRSKYHPFSMVLNAGRSWGTSGLPSYLFVGLGLSQGFNVGKWNFVLSDNVSYTPSTPLVGLSGIPGLGDLGVSPVQVGPDSGQGVLSNYSPEVNNIGSGSVQRQITGKTSLNASGSYIILRFVKGVDTAGQYGLDSDGITGSAGFTHRVDERTTFGGNYAYSSYIYKNNLSSGIPEPNFVSQVASFTYSHHLSRKFDLNLAAGPDWTQINFAQNSVSLSAYVDASLGYAGHTGHWNLSYIRSTNNGYGVTGGALADQAGFYAGRVYGRVWNLSTGITATRTTSLPTPGATPYDFKTVIASVQASRAVARNLSAFMSFTVEKQTHASSTSTVDLFDGTSEILSFGVTYSPASRQFGRP